VVVSREDKENLNVVIVVIPTPSAIPTVVVSREDKENLNVVIVVIPTPSKFPITIQAGGRNVLYSG